MLALLTVGAAAHSMSGVDRAREMRNAVQELRVKAAREGARAGKGLSTPTPPTFPKVWGARRDVLYAENGVPAAFAAFPPSWNAGSYYTQDTVKNRSCEKDQYKVAMVPESYIGSDLEWLNISSLTVGNFVGLNINGVKLQQYDGGQPFADFFGWLPHAHYGGKTEWGGESLDNWKFNYSGFTYDLEVSRANGKPVREVMVGMYQGKLLNITYLFSGFEENLDFGWWSEFNITEYTNPEVCGDSDPAPINQTMFIFHPVNKFNISNQDLGDAVGDTFFTCLTARMPNTSSAHDYQWITQWEIEIIPRWGQYLNCNNYPPSCNGNGNWYVGHEAAEAIGAGAGGQCRDNTLVGEWWSLPEGGRCAEGKRPGDGSCTWRIVERTKTIDSTCLFVTQKYDEACKTERAPFPNATGKFLDAFKSEDTAAGGCPALKVDYVV